ncbi:IS21 family transposase [Pectinatus frisingensis]|uniref:IS21 family transposase n=1 Tax=Pectinatus frisingensis TaxID=865 RepID=UPI002EDB5F07
MKDYKEIRQRYLRGESQRSIARALHLSRNTVAKYCTGAAVPWERKITERAPVALTAEVVTFIQQCLAEDEIQNVHKQHHTAKRIYDRLVAERGFTGGESTVRGKVRELKKTVSNAFIPLAFSPGEALQVDWGEAVVYINGVKQTIHLFCARLCFSCMPIVLAYRRQNEESFLDAFVRTFAQIGGIPEKVIFDNGKVAVKDGFGAHAKKQAGYTALSAHYGFDALFCNPAEGHEKGLVEGLVGWARRNILVPIPRVFALSELNSRLADRCKNYGDHQIQGKSALVRDLLQEEQAALRPLPLYPFETAKCSSVRVTSLSTIRFNTNDYSVPVDYVGRTVGVKGYAQTVKVYLGGKLIASHERCLGKHQSIYKLEHYLPLLEQRGRAILNAAPVRQNLPEDVFKELRTHANDPHEMMRILRQHCNLPQQEVPVITDVVLVQSVDLKRYDLLGGGKQVIAYGH